MRISVETSPALDERELDRRPAVDGVDDFKGIASGKMRQPRSYARERE